MQQRIAHITLVVSDYDEAIEFYTKKLKFTLVEDTVLTETKRWVLVRPPGSDGTALLLAKAANDEQKSRIGNQTGGRVFLFLHRPVAAFFLTSVRLQKVFIFWCVLYPIFFKLRVLVSCFFYQRTG